MCAACAREYHDPTDRRFHAQPTACPAAGRASRCRSRRSSRRLRGGEIVAIKGLGGFHVACDARNDDAVATPAPRQAARRQAVRRDGRRPRERARARRAEPTKRQRSSVRPAGRSCSHAASAPSRPSRPASPPTSRWLGVMLPSSPLHYLLFHEAAGRPRGVAWLEEPQTLRARHDLRQPGRRAARHRRRRGRAAPRRDLPTSSSVTIERSSCAATIPWCASSLARRS